MDKEIIDVLRSLEKQHEIIIVFAVNAGSRAWGFESEESDFDIRFVYFHKNLQKYMNITQTIDSITGKNKSEKIDYQGWDIRKAVVHLKESNPSILEWLYSPIVYIDSHDFKSECLKIVKKMHTHMSLMHHYYNMALRNWDDRIEGKNKIICKKYFYVIRPIATLLHIMREYQENNEGELEFIVEFDKLIEQIKKYINVDVYNDLLDLLESKKKRERSDELIDPIKTINNWCQQIFTEFRQMTKSETKDDETDIKIQGTISAYRKLCNECDKLHKISVKHVTFARQNYLDLIGSALQFLWLLENPDRDTKETPQKIGYLMTQVKSVTKNDKVMKEVSSIIMDLQEEEKIMKTNKSFEEIYYTFMAPIIKFFSENDDIEKGMKELDFSDKVIKSFVQTKIKPERSDHTEYIMKHVLSILWLIGNTDEGSKNIPTNILNVGDPTNTIPESVTNYAKDVVADMRPKYITTRNEIIHEWCNSIIEENKNIIKETQEKIVNIKAINNQRRLKHSIKKVSMEDFDNIISHVISWKPVNLNSFVFLSQ